MLPKLRLAQLLDLARAYELGVNLNGTKQKVLPIIMGAAEEGVFRRAPKHPYYLARAYYSSDDVKFAKGKLGDPDSPPDYREIPAQIKPWHGPLDEPAVRNQSTVSRETPAVLAASTIQRDAYAALKERAKELGIRIQGKTPKGLKAAVTHYEKRLAAQEAENAAQAAPEPAEAEAAV